MLGIGAALGGSLVKASYAASKERLMILSSIALDNLNPYAHSSGPQYGIWQAAPSREIVRWTTATGTA